MKEFQRLEAFPKLEVQAEQSVIGDGVAMYALYAMCRGGRWFRGCVGIRGLVRGRPGISGSERTCVEALHTTADEES